MKIIYIFVLFIAILLLSSKNIIEISNFVDKIVLFSKLLASNKNKKFAKSVVD